MSPFQLFQFPCLRLGYLDLFYTGICERDLFLHPISRLFISTDSNPFICLTMYHSELLEKMALGMGSVVLKAHEGQEH